MSGITIISMLHGYSGQFHVIGSFSATAGLLVLLASLLNVFSSSSHVPDLLVNAVTLFKVFVIDRRAYITCTKSCVDNFQKITFGKPGATHIIWPFEQNLKAANLLIW